MKILLWKARIEDMKGTKKMSENQTEEVLNENSELVKAIQQLKKGNEKGFETLYRKTYRYVYARAKMLFSDEQEVQDLVQETYLNVYKNISSLKTPESIYAWLKTIVFYQGTKLMKKNRKEVLLSEDNEEIFNELPDEEQETENDYINQQDVEAIRDCINRLPDVHRAVIVAHYFDNLKVEEMAELFNASIGTIKSRLFSARKKLKEHIEEQEIKQGYKFHSFGALTLLNGLRALMEQNMKIADIPNDMMYQNICNELQMKSVASVSNKAIFHKGGEILQRVDKIMLKKIVKKVAEVGMKKALLSVVGVVGATAITVTTVTTGIALIENKDKEVELLSSESVIEQTVESITIEAGEEFRIDVKDFLSVDGELAKKISVDVSQVDNTKVGKYTVVASYNGEEYKVNVIVKDTMKPEVILIKKLEETDDILKIDPMQFVEVKDVSSFEVKFVGFTQLEELSRDNQDELKLFAESLGVIENLEGISDEIPVEDGVYRAVIAVKDEYDNTSLNEILLVLDKEAVEDADNGNDTSTTNSSSTNSSSSSNTSSNTTVEQPKEEEVEQPKEEPEEEVETPGLTPTQTAVVQAGYYNVIAKPTGGYAVMVKGDEFQKGSQMIRDYVDSLGYECGGCYGGWIDSEKNQFLVCVDADDIREKVDINDEDFWS